MKSRCYNANDKRYARYGGRGITVCEEWHSFQAFRSWALENGYSDDKSIDRIDNDAGYSPQNCRWATPKEQCNNRSTNRLITINGTTKTVAQWAQDVGIHEDRIHNRLKRGWNEYDAVMLPLVSGVKYKNRRGVCEENTKEENR